ncbi:MAG: C-GCAxxG-C-C family protein [Sedimentisphaerales bacterium]|jgi:C_GCAxxG_C_C family probable redox protein
MSNADKAKAIYKEGFSCAPAVLATYCERFGLERDTALKIATGFGGGMHLGQTCGAVTGAIMVIGLKYGKTKADDNKSKEKTFELVKRLADKFRARYGSIECKALLGCDITTPEGLKEARDKKLFTTICAEYVGTAAEILDEIL